MSCRRVCTRVSSRGLYVERKVLVPRSNLLNFQPAPLWERKLHAQFLEGWTGAIPSGYSVIRPESGTAASGSRLHALNSVRSPITPDLPSQVFGLPLRAQQANLQGYNVTHRWA